jgi:hypothetical protein
MVTVAMAQLIKNIITIGDNNRLESAADRRLGWCLEEAIA